jgi:hypothetical protein
VEPAATGASAMGRTQGARAACAHTWECAGESRVCVLRAPRAVVALGGVTTTNDLRPRVTVAVDCADSSNQ